MFSYGSHVETVERVLPPSVSNVLKKGLRQYRLLTSAVRVLPDFIIIGARRSGTTSLYRYLAQHPNVLPALRKETFYFSHFFQNGERWYRSNFPTLAEKALYQSLRGGVITGEASPAYLLHPFVPERVRYLKADIRLIALLRNPVDAIYSAYHFGIKQGVYSDKEIVFNERVRQEVMCLNNPSSCRCDECGSEHTRHFLSQVIYADQLKPWFETFPKENILVLISEELFNSPEESFRRVEDFLGIPHSSPRTYSVFNDNNYPQMDSALRGELIRFYSPHNEGLANMLGRDLNWNE